MSHPFQAIPADKYLWVFVPLAGLTVILIAVFMSIPLEPDIVQFELNAEQVINSWNEAAKIRAAFSLGLDFLFLVIYSNTIALACIWAAKGFQIRQLLLATVGILLAWGQWLAALLDGVENIALVTILFGSITSPWDQLAKWCAIFKFILVILGLIYVSFCMVVKVWNNFVLK
jgi:hypothetical protein